MLLNKYKIHLRQFLIFGLSAHRLVFRVHVVDCLVHQHSQIGRRSAHGDSGTLQSLNLGLGSSLASSNNSTCVAHSSAWWGGDTGDEADNWLGVGSAVVFSEVVGGHFLGLATNLSDHDDTGGVWVVEEDFQTVGEVGSVERIAADANAKGLAKANLCGLVDGLIRKSSRPGNNTDLTFLVNMAWHNTNLATTRSDDTWTVWSDQSGLLLLDERRFHADHILLWDSLGNASNQWDLGFDSLQNGGSGHRWWDVDDGGVGAALFHGLSDGGKNRSVEMHGTGFSGVGASHNVGAVFDGRVGVESTLFTGETLDDELGVVTNGEIWPGFIVAAGRSRT